MAWEVEVTDEFQAWFIALEATEQQRIAAAVERLEQDGPGLGRPLVDSIEGSSVPNLKELRVGSVRVLFAFNPLRTALLLLGGDKRDRWQEWYDEAVPEAERLWAEHLRELRIEGLWPDTGSSAIS